MRHAVLDCAAVALPRIGPVVLDDEFLQRARPRGMRGAVGAHGQSLPRPSMPPGVFDVERLPCFSFCETARVSATLLTRRAMPHGARHIVLVVRPSRDGGYGESRTNFA